MLSFVVGVILLPVSEIASVSFARSAFGLGALLFVGQALGLAAHYQLYNRQKSRQFVWFPTQEKVALARTSLVAVLYLLVILAK